MTGEFAASRRWRSRVAAGEGVRSALAGRWVSAVMLLLVIWAGALPGAVDAVTVAGLVADEQRFLDAGGEVLVVVNRDAGVPALACERLASTGAVRASAALSHQGEPATLTTARGGDVTAFAVTAGIWRLLGVEASQHRDVILPTSTAERLGLRDGDWIELERSPGTGGSWIPPEPVRVTVANMEVLGDEYTGVLLPTVATPAMVAEACVVSAEPAALPALRSSLPAALPGVSGQPVVVDRLITGEFTADPAAAYRQRPLQWAWLLAGLLIGLVWLLMRWMRRADDAVYATMGADPLARLLLRSTEWGVLVGLGGVWAVALGVALAVAADTPYPIALTYVTRHVGAVVLVAAAAMLLGQLRRPRSLLADLKDR